MPSMLIFSLLAHQKHFFLWKTAQILIIPMLVTPVLGPDSLPSAAARPRGLVPCGNPPLPITANRLTQNLPHHYHIALVQLCGFMCTALFFLLYFSLPLLLSLFFFLTLFSLHLPFPPSNHHADIPSCPPGSGCSTRAAALLAKNRCPRNTRPVREKGGKHMEAD